MRDRPEDWRNAALAYAIRVEAEVKYGVPKGEEDNDEG